MFQLPQYFRRVGGSDIQVYKVIGHTDSSIYHHNFNSITYDQDIIVTSIRNLCDCNDIGDEFHDLFKCHFFKFKKVYF